MSEVLAEVRHPPSELICELCSTFGASSFENFSAVSGCHSFSEPVLFFSLSLFGLICSYHFGTSFKFQYDCKAILPAYSHKDKLLYNNIKILSSIF